MNSQELTTGNKTEGFRNKTEGFRNKTEGSSLIF